MEGDGENYSEIEIYLARNSGGFRNLERGVQLLAREARVRKFLVATPTSGHLVSPN